MSDMRSSKELVKSLRAYSEGPSSYWMPICKKAANEIERLGRELQRARDTIDTFEMAANPRPAHEPATELSDDFRKGARAMFDSLLCRAANNYHGNPSVDAACTEENKIVTAWAADALAEVSVDDWNEWASITDLRRENDELKAQVRASPPPSAVLVNAFRAGAFYGCAEEFNPLDLQRDAEAYGSRHSPTKAAEL
jgi:hypothetical protein